MHVNRCCKFGRQKCDKESSREDFKIQKPYNRNTMHVECKNKCDISNNTGNWNNLKIIQKIPEQHTGKVQNQENTENSHIGHSTHTVESTDVKVQ